MYAPYRARLSVFVGVASCIWLLVVALSCFRQKPLLKAYVGCEILLSIPGMLRVWALIGGGDVFGRFDWLLPFTVIFIFSVVPISLAILELRQRGRGR
jgi:hypothetical protein